LRHGLMLGADEDDGADGFAGRGFTGFRRADVGDSGAFDPDRREIGAGEFGERRFGVKAGDDRGGGFAGWNSVRGRAGDVGAVWRVAGVGPVMQAMVSSSKFMAVPSSAVILIIGWVLQRRD